MSAKINNLVSRRSLLTLIAAASLAVPALMIANTAQAGTDPDRDGDSSGDDDRDGDGKGKKKKARKRG
jgi:hypothetical protein